MKRIEGIITEITEGMESDAIAVTNGKLKSKIKLPVGDSECFEIGAKVTIIIESDATLFNREAEKE